ncbi:heterokaryon incompatibility protein-domain-containing protein [Massariosphaeria phaeospora]|uniref:Heterokaryon incompatibility protein-domain-containing protein n=1 Tax=Massariosphaeria phaeospora TaxID=100035 RepID=A0A7C8MGC9_9PLEO|nr:heterokaryon incompatibility protein-domain-containing protein [Massariosphaeria phaeospora]
MAGLESRQFPSHEGEGRHLYQYEPLQSSATLRILCLDPAGTKSLPLRASIIHINRYEELARVNGRQKYHAVSYTWGEPIFSQRLLLNSDCYLPITEKVQVMLQHFRRPHKKRFLWIDAICLNQKDDAEKGQQIPLMGDIYGLADKVHFWLGVEDGHDVAKVFAAFRARALVPGRLSMSDIFDDDESARKEMNLFFQRPWFFRRWILQEVALSRYATIFCGSHSIPYSTFVAACQQLDSAHHSYGVRMALTLTEKDCDIYTLLWNLHQSACFDKRDRIAALCGLQPSCMRRELDYQARYQDIYTQYAVALVNSPSQRDLILHLYEFGSLQAPTGDMFPSWIPDWSQERHARPPGLLLSHDSANCHQEIPVGVDIFWKECERKQPAAVHTKKPPEHSLTPGKSSAATLLLPLAQNFYLEAHPPSSKRINNAILQDICPSRDVRLLSVLIETFMVNQGSESLRHWEDPLRILIIAWAINALFRDSPDYRQDALFECTPEYGQKWLVTTFDKSGAELTNTFSAITTELIDILYRTNTAIVQLEPGNLKEPPSVRDRAFDYAIGPSSLEQGSLLLPLTSATQTSMNSWVPHSSNPAVVRNNVDLLNMIAVKPIDVYAEQMDNGRFWGTVETRGNAGNAKSCIEATYSGLCIGITDRIAQNFPSEDKDHSLKWPTSVVKGYKQAEQSGQPLPFTVNIV